MKHCSSVCAYLCLTPAHVLPSVLQQSRIYLLQSLQMAATVTQSQLVFTHISGMDSSVFLPVMNDTFKDETQSQTRCQR